MAGINKEQVLEFVRNNDLDWDESYPRSDWWKFRDERDAYKKQRDELINDMTEVKKKARAWDRLKEEVEIDLPIVKERTEEYKLKWQSEGSSWTLTDYYEQIGRLKQLMQVANFIEDLECGSDVEI